MSESPSFWPEPSLEKDERFETADRLAREWGLTFDGVMAGATESLVLTAGESVLRIPFRKAEGTAMLRAFASHGGISVLREDSESGAVLLPRLRPGLTLDTLDEDGAVEAWIALVRRMRPAKGDAPSVAEEITSLWSSSTELRLAHDAPSLARHLIETAPTTRFLHGDLHHFNVLRDGEQWIAIDPQGVMGDPAYECAAFLRNPVPHLGRIDDLPDLLRRRIDRLAEGLDYPAARIWGWAFARTALCVWRDPTPFDGAWLAVTRALDGLGPNFIDAL